MKSRLREIFSGNKEEIGKLFRFVFSAGSSFLLDLALFQFLVWVLKGKVEPYILLSTIGARICSSIYNFAVSKTFVFRNSDGIGKTMVKYYILYVCQMLVSAGCVSLLYRLTKGPESVIKFFVDVVLCLVSFVLQRQIVFKNEPETDQD